MASANIARVSIEVQIGIFTGGNNVVILFDRGLGLKLKIRASPNSTF